MKPPFGDRTRLLLSALALAVLALLLMWVVFSVVPTSYLHQISSKWVRFAVVTIVFIGYCLKTYWRARKMLHFWAILLGVLAIHLLGIGYFFYTGSGLPLAFFGPLVAGEWAMLAIVVYRTLGIAPDVKRTTKVV